MSYDRRTLARFTLHAIPLLVLLLALFGFAVELLDFEPRSGSVVRLALFEQPRVPAPVVIGAWLIEASGLLALFLLAQGRCGAWWLDGLVAGWIAWIFRGPLLVITIVVAVRQPQHAWWTLAFGWWVLYSIAGLSLAILYRRSQAAPEKDEAPDETEALPAASDSEGEPEVSTAQAGDGADEPDARGDAAEVADGTAEPGDGATEDDSAEALSGEDPDAIYADAARTAGKETEH